MLIVPISGKIGWKNPPVVTLLLILINCLCFFLFQRNDSQAWLEAEQFYLDSGLAGIEVPHYLSYQAEQGKTDLEIEDISDMDSHRLLKFHFEMEADALFVKRLLAEQVIAPQDSQYEQWRTLRRRYAELRDKSVAFAHGLRPAFPRVSAFFTHMFLHAGFGHLFGNMVFLWILGCMLEIGCGKTLFAVIYFVSGFLASGAFWLVYSSSTTPLVGASGAIAGLMGAYTVLYGKTRVSVFYSLGFYFDTARIPAIVLLPLWLLNECYQLVFTESHVAYVAHMGGIAGGAALAFAGERFWGTAHRESFEASPEEKVNALMAQAVEHIGNLEMDQARGLFEKILESSPDNREALTHLFNIHKLTPESNTFHDIAKRLLQVLLRNAGDTPAALACYKTYAGLVRRPALTIPVYLQIAGAMVTEGELEAAEKIVLAILKNKPATPGLPSSMVKLSQAFHKNGQPDQCKRYRSLVCQKYPESVEADIILRSDATG